MRAIVLVIVVMAAAGCATAPSAAQIEAADYGLPISQDDAQAIAVAWLSTRLKDPYSAQIEWGPVERAWIRLPPVEGFGLVFGYRITAMINAKNSYGAYIGARPYAFVLRNRALHSVWEGNFRIGP